MNDEKELICAHCGLKNDAGARFCEKCGKPLAPAPPPWKPPAAAPAVSPASVRKPASRKWIFGLAGGAVLLALLCVAAAGAFFLFRPGGIIEQARNPEVAEPESEEVFPDLQPEFVVPPRETAEDTQSQNEPEPAATAPRPTALPTLKPAEPTSAPDLIRKVSTSQEKFYCLSSEGTTKMTVTVLTEGDSPPLDILWRLKDKREGKVTDWKTIEMARESGDTYSFQFNADAWGAKNNFYYPPHYHESVFEFQISARDGSFTSPVYTMVTFFPCAQ